MAGEIITALSHFFPDLVSEVSTVKKYALGTKREEDGKVYRYVKYEQGTGSVAAVVNKLCYHVDGLYDVTSDVSDVDPGMLAGVLMGVIADEGFGWMLVRGRVAALKTDAGDDIVKGDRLIPHASTDGVVDRIALTAGGVTGTEGRAGFDGGWVGTALADDIDADDTVDAFVSIE